MAFNSQRTFRAPTFRSQVSVARVYETLEPRSEPKETDEAHFLHVYLPGYTKDQIKITLQEASKVLRISGVRPIPGNKWRKFDQTYPVPENSDIGTLEANFEQGTLILKIKKKLISQSQVVAPKQEVEKSQQSSSNNKDLDEAKLEKVQETIPPTQPTKLEESTQDMKSDSPQTQSIEKETREALDDDTMSQTTKETISNNEPQKGQQEFEPKSTFKDRSKTQEDEKVQNGPQEDKKARNGPQEFESKPTFKDTTKTQLDENAQKAQEEFEPKPIEKVVTKENLVEKIIRKSDEYAEKERILKKEEIEEKNEKPYESRKTMKDVKENEIEKEHSALKVIENEKKTCSIVSSKQEEKNGISKLAAPSTQSVARMEEEKWRGDQRYLIENVSAAILVVVAFGAYVSYRFSS